MIPAKRQPTHAGEMLLHEFLEPMGMSQAEFARHLNINTQRLNEIVKGKRGISPETAWLLSQAFGTTPEFWANLQMTYDLYNAQPEKSVKRLKLKVA
ncbi:MAG: HigA family addiction module antitoxin [Fibrobacterales bacterium]